MSGGSFEYLYRRIEDAADQIEGMPAPHLKAFAAHLRLVARALHDIEWVASLDSAKGSEEAAVRKCLSKCATLDSAIAIGIEAINLLKRELERAQAERAKNPF